MSSMNDAQIIFTLFFAISWGIVSNVLPRWKPFHYALCFRLRQPTCRLIISWLLLNIVPWLLFALVLYALGRPTAKVDNWRSWSSLWLIVRSVPPGLIPFGCYHLWLALMHAIPTCFFAETEDDVPAPFGKVGKVNKKIKSIEPNATSLGLMVPGRSIPGMVGNFVFGILCLVFGLLVAFCY